MEGSTLAILNKLCYRKQTTLLKNERQAERSEHKDSEFGTRNTTVVSVLGMQQLDSKTPGDVAIIRGKLLKTNALITYTQVVL